MRAARGGKSKEKKACTLHTHTSTYRIPATRRISTKAIVLCSSYRAHTAASIHAGEAGVNETISRFQLILLHDLAVRRTRRAQLSFSTGVNDNDNPPKRFEAGLPGFEFGEPGLAGFEFGEPGLLALRAGRRPYGLSFLP